MSELAHEHEHIEIRDRKSALVMRDVAEELDGVNVEKHELSEDEQKRAGVDRRMVGVAVKSPHDTGELYKKTDERLESLPDGEFLTNLRKEDVRKFRQETSIPDDELVFGPPLGVAFASEGDRSSMVGVYRKKKQ
ncbi:MAG: hypothetical protein NTV39_03640 [Candidatus Saccharibacteria bacterium]|nr:hypothetical protein [Candidatus Saccharibacteria bacterium]